MSRISFPINPESSLIDLFPIGADRRSRKARKEDKAKDFEQFQMQYRKRLQGGEGFLFVRFKETEYEIVEHCVAESGWQCDLWECPCDECKPWLPKWRHLFGALWGAKRVYDLADTSYNNLTTPTEEEWTSLGLDKDINDVGHTWECIQWENTIIPSSEDETDNGTGTGTGSGSDDGYSLYNAGGSA
jgi:hypothetical protein